MPPRLSQPGLRVLRHLLDTAARQSGADLTRATGAATGTIYPMLRRLEAIGWLKSAVETTAPQMLRRPRKRMYGLTAVGKRAAQQALEELAG